jgi:hypothetical protein
MVLSQLVDADELKAMSPEELRDMLASLDDDVIYAEEGEDGGEGTELRAATAKPEA